MSAELPRSRKPCRSEVKELALHMCGLATDDPEYAKPHARLTLIAPTGAQLWPLPQLPCVPPALVSQAQALPVQASPHVLNDSCFMCGRPHWLENCAVAFRYVKARHVVQLGPYLAFPDFSRIRPHPVTCLLQTTIDEKFGFSLAPPSPSSSAQHSHTVPSQPVPPSLRPLRPADASSSWRSNLPSATIDLLHVTPLGQVTAQPPPAHSTSSLHATAELCHASVRSLALAAGISEDPRTPVGPGGPNLSSEGRMCRKKSPSNVKNAASSSLIATAADAIKAILVQILDAVVPGVPMRQLLAASSDFSTALLDYLQEDNVSTLPNEPPDAWPSKTTFRPPLSLACPVPISV